MMKFYFDYYKDVRYVKTGRVAAFSKEAAHQLARSDRRLEGYMICNVRACLGVARKVS